MFKSHFISDQMSSVIVGQLIRNSHQLLTIIKFIFIIYIIDDFSSTECCKAGRINHIILKKPNKAVNRCKQCSFLNRNQEKFRKSGTHSTIIVPSYVTTRSSADQQFQGQQWLSKQSLLQPKLWPARTRTDSVL